MQHAGVHRLTMKRNSEGKNQLPSERGWEKLYEESAHRNIEMQMKQNGWKMNRGGWMEQEVVEAELAMLTK